MTQNLIYSDTSSENLANTKSDNYLLAVESDDWELRMAQLVGLEVESISAEEEELLESSANLQPLPSQPTEEKTEQSLSSNPFAKLGLVGTGTLVIVLFAGGFLSQLMNSNNQKPTRNIVSSEIKPSVNPKSREESLAETVETLKTKLALTEQAVAVKSAQQQLRSGRIRAVTQNSQPDNSQYRQTLVTRIPTPSSIVYVPTTVTGERIVRYSNPQQPVPQPSLLPQSIISQPQTQLPPLVNVTPIATPNPLQDWELLAKLGSYGQVSATNKSNPNVKNVAEENNNQEEQQTSNNQPEQALQPTSRVGQRLQQSPKSVAIGSHSKGVLATAIFGETAKSKDSDNSNIFVARLKEPLKAVDGAIALPANTELLTEVSSISEQGLIQLKVGKIILPNQGQITERSLPENALIIRAPQGKPLIANQFPNKGSSIASMDLGLFVLGGLGKAAELANRTESQVVTTTAGGTIVSNTNPERNIFAGILEGGINTVVPQIVQRNQQAISQMSQRTNVWFLPAGTAIEIYVNQPIQF
ncbi:TrbI/VirB10 family protein [Tolypothrix sp. PCC 7910]|uniref:TrbI/VirB10 family protein n=1 Tax=Tolypothrix sp. PCC 7910 TaxID=2099387 RepID=UPI0014277F95|nr:TrbI/VirB10 family protein [Tolypothrix sp. PCC 7910]QIR39694.1 TrbI/VirB10 family protein [Tolypothrix sp. PCC 7910]